NSWSTLTVVPGPVGYGGAMIRNGADNDIYVMRDYNSTGFYKYSISGNSWSTLPVVPGAVGEGGAMIRNGADNDIYVMRGNGSTGFYKYTIGRNEFALSGAFESATIDMAAASDFTTLAWDPSSQPANTSITLQVAANNNNSTWAYTTVANGGSLSGFNGNRYIRYKASLATTDTAVTSSLNDITLNYVSGGSAYTAATSDNVLVLGGPASKVVLSGTVNVAADAVTALTITAQDAYNNTTNVSANTNFNLTVAPLASGKFYSDVGVTEITTTTIDSGTNNKVIYFKATAAMAVQPVATAARASGDSVGSANLTYTITGHGTPAVLAFTTQPSSSATAGVNFLTQPVVTLYDTYSNVCTNSTLGITLAAYQIDGTTPAAGTLNGNLSVNAIAGVATFTGINYTKAESIKLKATATGPTAVNSNTIVVAANTPTKIVILTQPSPTSIAGLEFGQQPVFAVQDIYNNTIISDNSTQITLSRGATGTD
ncbi:MAG: hypothetical protein COX96_05800, partial [Candidatus Omnitrophica bacterium CG_4_10_14_0_2_um_filter_44_9]